MSWPNSSIAAVPFIHEPLSAIRSGAIRTPEIDAAASAVARQPAVRRVLVERQRELAKRGGTVMEGRDIGTVVFPGGQV